MTNTTFNSSNPHLNNRLETCLLILILLTGIGFRWAELTQISVEHFDEGVYASNLFFGLEQGGAYPARHLYAPPGFPLMVEISQTFLGTTHLGTMLTSLLTGSLTLILLWWVGRSWFDQVIGLSLASIAATSDFHILYSRTALTDATLTFWFILSVWLIWKTYQSTSFGWAIAAGIACGFAWATKYNGWLTLAIASTGLVPWLIAKRKYSSQMVIYFLLLFMMVAVACLVFSPVLFNLPPPGYSAVAANHARYFTGLSQWVGNATQQVVHHNSLTGWVGGVGLGLACLLTCLLRDRKREMFNGCFTWNKLSAYIIQRLTCPILIVVLVVYFGIGSVLVISSFCGLMLILTRCMRGLVYPISNAETAHQSLTDWMIASWYIGLSVGTPLYYPYPRITLPWLIAAWICTAIFFNFYANWMISYTSTKFPQTENPIPNKRIRLSQFTTLIVFGATVTGIGLSGIVSQRPFSPGLMQRTGIESVAEHVLKEVRELSEQTLNNNFALYVYGEPALFFHLRKEHVPVLAAGNLQFAAETNQRSTASIFLLAGPHAHRSQDFQRELALYSSRLTPLKKFPCTQSQLVRMNHFGSSDEKPSSQAEFKLYRLIN